MMNINDPDPFLIGNSFPFSLIRRPVRVRPRNPDDLRQALSARAWKSFWGHANTVAAASQLLGFDLRPTVARPAIELDAEGLPQLDGMLCREVWVLSPNYIPGFRPALNEETPAENILGWQVLHIVWEKDEG